MGGAAGDYNDGGDASGGGLNSLGGDVTLTSTQFLNNQAIGGAGGNDSSTIYGGVGGTAQGAGIFSSGTVTSTYSNGTFIESVLTLTLNATNLTLLGNQAIAGAGGSGGTGGVAGDAQGGGLYNYVGAATLSGGTIADNQAVGGAGGNGSSGGSGGAGGDAQGGGLYSTGDELYLYNNGEFEAVAVASTLTASNFSLLGNLAQGGAGGAGNGSGIGGDGGSATGGGFDNDPGSTAQHLRRPPLAQHRTGRQGRQGGLDRDRRRRRDGFGGAVYQRRSFRSIRR